MDCEIPNDLQTTISHALHEMEVEAGKKLDPKDVNLAELGRRTGISRKRLRKLKEQGFEVKPHASLGRRSLTTKISRFTGTIDGLLKNGVSNSQVIFERIKEEGYNGGLTRVKNYISEHSDLLPTPRHQVAPQGNRGRRYSTGPGESYQMDWGFQKVVGDIGNTWKVSCFAMICHHCGERFVEYFPNAKQENLFIGMIHAFIRMGVPRYILTDNMKSVVTGRDSEGNPLWNVEFCSFMTAVGFETKLCKPRHPFTKGAVERLIQFVKNNFAAGLTFGTVTDLNFEAIKWCDKQNAAYHKCVDCIPHEKHVHECMSVASKMEITEDILPYLWPERTISFDGFISYEGRRFGVPYWYREKTCRVQREDYKIYIYSRDLRKELSQFNVTWSKKDQFCPDQYAFDQPEEYPTAPVNATIVQVETKVSDDFSSFNFDREVRW